MLRSDLEDVHAIERVSFDHPANLGEFVYLYNKPSTVGLVAEFQDELAAFAFYQRTRTYLCLLGLAVAPEFRRMGVGTQLVKKIIAKLTTRRQPRLACLVDDEWLGAQLFFRSLGFLATNVIAAKDRLEKTDEDAYAFEYNLESAPGCGVHR